MFSKVLVANRGEIAVRVLQTLQAMGIATVAVYSDPDKNAPHVTLADQAYSLNGVSAEETYLDSKKLIALAKESGAEAIHPGYGFLSENPSFCADCTAAGLVFIGPNSDTISLLGDKIRSKETAIRAGVPVVPSSPLWEPGETHHQGFLSQWGFPLLVKATAGGGGRGMRLVEREAELLPALESASREAASAFGDGRVFLERFFPDARHVEFQVLADASGNTIHLMERECSVQRRYQKVIEETPSPALDRKLRESMGESAVALAKSAGYTNAGTVEFLVDPTTGQYYFLEMNARIQVEHPITEETLRMDLVQWQVRIAAGGNLTLSQNDIRSSGHALECRIYAEDAYDNFAPSTGTLLSWQPPHGMGLRLDSGVSQGQEVTPYYDSMLAKLVSWGADRQASINRMSKALENFPVVGVTTNIPFLMRAIHHPAFTSGNYDTRFVAMYGELTAPGDNGRIDAAAMELAEDFWQASVPKRAGTRTTGQDRPQGPWESLGRASFP
ncbi:MAG TPA: acetyl-CoA carboxylase biotin carboxylase subunit [Dehalococcoidia bacterium]|nr:acetyl-CoA carboxylase biotin carboxylase subunit [Dehalococcoidia bacterium]